MITVIVIAVTTAIAVTWWLLHDTEPTCIELQSTWIVSGIVWHDCDRDIESRGYAAEFAAPTMLDAIRQYGEHVRAAGMWVETVEDVMRTGVCTVDVRKRNAA